MMMKGLFEAAQGEDDNEKGKMVRFFD